MVSRFRRSATSIDAFFCLSIDAMIWIHSINSTLEISMSLSWCGLAGIMSNALGNTGRRGIRRKDAKRMRSAKVLYGK